MEETYILTRFTIVSVPYKAINQCRNADFRYSKTKQIIYLFIYL